MSQIVKLRRSSISGKIPTNDQLQLGELSINTTDGKLYFAKSGSLNASIEEILTTNTQNTGSLNLSGSINLIGTENITGSQKITGSLSVTGATSLTSLVVSGSDPVANVQAFVPSSSIYNSASFNTPDRVASGIRFNWNSEDWTIGAARGLTTDIDGLIFSRNGVRKYMIDEDGNASLSGSMIISGSLFVSGSQHLSGSQYLSGALTLYPTQDPDPNGETTTATHFFVSASNNQTGEDLYIRQQDNKVKWKWFEGKLNSGILWGGSLSYSGSNIYITKGSGIVVDQRASATSEISPNTHYVNWNDITASCYHLTSSLATYVGIDLTGSLYQQTDFFTVNQYKTTIPIGMFNHTNKTSITSVSNNVITSYDDVNQTSNFIQAFGPLKIDGLSISPQSGNLQITIEAGQSYLYGGFYQQNPNDASHKSTNQVVSPQIARVYRDGSGSFIVDNNNGSFYTTVNPTVYDNGSGTLASVGSGNWSIQRVFFNPVTNRVHIYYGQTIFTTLALAKSGLANDPFVEAPYSTHQYVFVGFIILRGNATNIADTQNNLIVQSGLFRNTIGSAGSSLTLSSLHDLSDTNTSGSLNGDLLRYNSTTNTWDASKSLDGNYHLTGSLDITGSLFVNGALVGTGKLNSTEFYNYTSSATSVIASSSYAQTASYVLNPIVVSGVTRTSVVSSPTATWSFNHQMGQRYPSVQIFDNNGYVVIPSEIKAVDENNVNVYFSQPQTGVLSVTLGGAGTAGTSGTSGTSGRDGLGGYTHTYTASTTWSVAHNLGMDFPIVTAWDTNRKVILPTEIYSVDTNNIEVYFSQPIAGTISVIKIL